MLELDVGLHRGGFTADKNLRDTLQAINNIKSLHFSGFMGYEPHLASIPTALGWREREKLKSWKAYQRALAMAATIFGREHVDSMLRNAAGSPTYRLYQDTAIANEIAVGSALVKPSHFDMDMLQPLQPACFIATPVLKSVGKTQLPALEMLDGLKRLLRPGQAQTFFIHGGNWLADPVYPRGLSYNKTFGRSSNQEMLNGPAGLDLQTEDFVFFRPQQSEAIFLQFGDLVIIDGREVVDYWPTCAVSA